MRSPEAETAALEAVLREIRLIEDDQGPDAAGPVVIPDRPRDPGGGHGAQRGDDCPGSGVDTPSLNHPDR